MRQHITTNDVVYVVRCDAKREQLTCSDYHYNARTANAKGVVVNVIGSTCLVEHEDHRTAAYLDEELVVEAKKPHSEIMSIIIGESRRIPAAA